jgi:hypothetical protein
MLLLPAWTAKWVPWRTFLWAMARVRKVDISNKENEALKSLHSVYPGALTFGSVLWAMARVRKRKKSVTMQEARAHTASLFG